MSLAHHGVLFLDELPEFKRSTLEVLRQPLEDGVVTISRASSSITFPARFMLVASMNPCFCGYYGDSQRACTCAPQRIQQYRARISGPLLDRIDIQIQVAAVPFRELTGEAGGEGSAAMRARVSQARGRQESRFAKARRVFANAQMSAKMVQEHCALGPEARRLLEAAVERLGLSARAYSRILKIARTIADLEGEPAIALPHVAEAVQYRSPGPPVQQTPRRDVCQRSGGEVFGLKIKIASRKDAKTQRKGARIKMLAVASGQWPVKNDSRGNQSPPWSRG